MDGEDVSEDLPQWAVDKARQTLANNSALSRGMDLLHADGMPDDRAAELLLACVGDGRDPEAFAQHLLKLRRAFRGGS